MKNNIIQAIAIVSQIVDMQGSFSARNRNHPCGNCGCCFSIPSSNNGMAVNHINRFVVKQITQIVFSNNNT
jgi:hypothetical protein